MEPGIIEFAMRIATHRGAPYIESRARVGSTKKTLVLRTPILPPGASRDEIEAKTERELIDESGS
jgi:hypothetical protein